MKKYIPVLKAGLFTGVGEEEILSMLNCLGTLVRNYQKGEYVFRQGEHIHSITLLAEGKLLIQKEDYWGNLDILNVIEPGEIFGEAYAAPDSGPLLNDVVATENSVIFFFDIERILSACPTACKFHSTIIQNLFFTISEKNRKLVQKLGHLSKRSTREKLIAYLSEEAKRHNSRTFEIPFNRQQLADYLSVDRSAMSNELCKMRDDGLLSFKKNHFTLHQKM